MKAQSAEHIKNGSGFFFWILMAISSSSFFVACLLELNLPIWEIQKQLVYLQIDIQICRLGKAKKEENFERNNQFGVDSKHNQIEHAE